MRGWRKKAAAAPPHHNQAVVDFETQNSEGSPVIERQTGCRSSPQLSIKCRTRAANPRALHSPQCPACCLSFEADSRTGGESGTHTSSRRAGPAGRTK